MKIILQRPVLNWRNYQNNWIKQQLVKTQFSTLNTFNIEKRNNNNHPYVLPLLCKQRNLHVRTTKFNTAWFNKWKVIITRAGEKTNRTTNHTRSNQIELQFFFSKTVQSMIQFGHKESVCTSVCGSKANWNVNFFFFLFLQDKIFQTQQIPSNILFCIFIMV